MSALRLGVIMVRCPHCGEEGRGPDFLSDWDDETYLLACGHRSHLDEKNGGARTWIDARGSETPEARRPE